MEFSIINDTGFAIVIDNFLPLSVNKKILDESVSLKKQFQDGVIGGGLNKKFRSNMVAYYDNIYNGIREKSVLLNTLNKVFSDPKIRELLASSPFPLSEFSLTNNHETQVSRYGDDGQKYDYHIDRFDDNQRMITLVYYFHTQPQKFKGGEIEFTNSPIVCGKPIEKNAKTTIVKPINNRAVIFSSVTPHRVLPTISPKKFDSGRFSVNCWIGIKK